MTKAFAEEHGKLHATYHTQSEFFAEVFARYSLDRERAKKLCPQSVNIIDLILKEKGMIYNPETEPKVDASKLRELLEARMAADPVECAPDCW